MEKDKTHKSSMFCRLRGDKEPKLFVVTRIKIGGKSSNLSGTLVIISYEASSNSKVQIKEDEQPSSHPIIDCEADNLEADIGPIEVPETSKNEKAFNMA